MQDLKRSKAPDEVVSVRHDIRYEGRANWKRRAPRWIAQVVAPRRRNKLSSRNTCAR